LSYQISKIKRDIEKLAVGVSVSDPSSWKAPDIDTESSLLQTSHKTKHHFIDTKMSSESQPKPPRPETPEPVEKEKMTKKKKVE
jgi:hypothetical protein